MKQVAKLIEYKQTYSKTQTTSHPDETTQTKNPNKTDKNNMRRPNNTTTNVTILPWGCNPDAATDPVLTNKSNKLTQATS